jgi:hypothetical protein
MTRIPSCTVRTRANRLEKVPPKETEAYQGRMAPPVIKPQHHQTFFAARRCRGQRTTFRLRDVRARLCAARASSRRPWIEHSDEESRVSTTRFREPSTHGGADILGYRTVMTGCHKQSDRSSGTALKHHPAECNTIVCPRPDLLVIEMSPREPPVPTTGRGWVRKLLFDIVGRAIIREGPNTKSVTRERGARRYPD